MAGIQAGDERALEALYHRYANLLSVVIKRTIYDHDQTPDLLQEVLVQIWNRANHYSVEKGRALGWLITVARCRALDHVRRLQALYRGSQRLLAAKKQAGTAEECVDGDAELRHQDLTSILADALDRLPPPQAHAVRLAFHEGLSQRDIVAKTGIPLGTIKTRIELGLRKLKSALAPEFGAKYSGEG